jgi:hypothetical protein
MTNLNWKLLALSALLSGSIIVVGCGDDGTEDADATDNSGDDDNGGNRPDGGGGGSDDDAGTSDPDISIRPDSGGGGTEDDATDPGTDTEGPDFSAACDTLAVTAQEGDTCDPAVEGSCGATGACLNLQGGDGPKCFTLCLPDVCDNSPCAGTSQCTPLVAIDPETEEQTPAEVDLDGDGTDDTALGACFEQEAGTQEVYENCGNADGACVAGADCLGISTTAGLCASECTTAADCPEEGGVAGVCAGFTLEAPDGTTSNANLCVLQCTAAGSDECPAGYTCTSAAGAFLCIQD